MADIGPFYTLTKGPDIWSVQVSPANWDDLSHSKEGHALTPHTDAVFLRTPPIVQFLYCVANETRGGESVVVDVLTFTMVSSPIGLLWVVYFARIGQQSLRTGVYPPTGTVVVRRTRIRTGKEAVVLGYLSIMKSFERFLSGL